MEASVGTKSGVGVLVEEAEEEVTAGGSDGDLVVQFGVSGVFVGKLDRNILDAFEKAIRALSVVVKRRQPDNHLKSDATNAPPINRQRITLSNDS